MDIFLARQAIYNRSKAVMAYELLYRNSMSNKYDKSIDSSKATYAVVENLLSIGLDNIISNKKALINCDEKILLSDIIYLLPKNNIIIEILETVVPTYTILKRLKELKELGFKLALDDVIDVKSMLPYLKYISLVKIDYSLTDANVRKEIVKLAKEYDIEVLAEKIETEVEFLEAYDSGMEYFQGYFFSKPSILKGKDVIIRNSTVIQVLNEVAKTDIDLNEVENLIKSDVILTYKLMNYINSAHFGFKMEISSVKQAIMLIGIEMLRKWLSMVAFLDLNKGQCSEYTNSSIIRAKFCENIALRVAKRRASEAFMVGVFSEVHLIIKEDTNDIVNKLPVNDEIKAALLGRQNCLKDILDLVISYEKMQIDDIIKKSKKIKIDSTLLRDEYFRSIKWVEDLCSEYNV